MSSVWRYFRLDQIQDDPTNSVKVLKEKATRENNPKNTKKTENTHMHRHTK